ncbi:thioredoxin-like negative regulator of GroEL [Actinokineospora baliensis]|uniref:FxSxx-COOH system tetratricopeptide repeat protein n=1 Tax=Actinokineospora baliensis TaxID=547056 RepID=UPI00195DE6B7|nr:FxSxx-COOH system tetratricopeptide repeat protein [Actinokineospora baliensis]MBM7776022.1 thioredoxin-like negative regulator of GroEL [Actinokineospora baliensis]
MSGLVSGHVLQAGSIHGDVHLSASAAREPVGLPYRFGPVPTRVRGFQQRMMAAPVTGDGLVGVVTGLGGVGKTQLAADYAHRLWDGQHVQLLVWITATSRDAILATYARLAAELTGVHGEDAEQATRRTLDWLNNTEYRWLVVFDDVQAPADLAGLWPPRATRGQVLVTTRRRDAALTRVGPVAEVGLFTSEESIAYLRTLLNHRADLAEGGVELAEALGHLPLALSQAAAYLADRDLTCIEYLCRFHDRARRLVQVLPDPDALPDEHQNTIAATWSLSVEAADQLPPVGLAAPLLRLCALLNGNGIPLSVLMTDSVLTHLTQATGRHIDGEQTRDGLTCLHRLNLITFNPGALHLEVRVHALVQRATRDDISEKELTRLAYLTASALAAAWPDIERDTALAASLRANTLALHTNTGELLWNPEAHLVLFKAGNSLCEAGQPAAARDHFADLLNTANHLLGSNHPDTLVIRHNLARCLGETGDAAGAAALLTKLHPQYVRALGPDHPETLTNRHSLAYWRGEAGDAAAAKNAFAELVEDCLRVYGSNDPRTLTARGNLAGWQGLAGDAVQAAQGFAELLEDCLRVVGPDHPTTFTIRNSLAFWRNKSGNAAEGAAEIADLLEDQQRVLGPNHPSTLATRHNLVHLRGQVGDATGAVTASAKLLDDCLRALGPEHPATLITRDTHAYWQGRSGNVRQAAENYTKLLDDCLRILGPDHPITHATLTSRGELATWQGETGDATGAAVAFAELLDDCLRILGPSHPNTLIARGNLAGWQAESGDADAATKAYAKLLDDCIQILGPDDPATLASRRNLKFWQEQTLEEFESGEQMRLW